MAKRAVKNIEENEKYESVGTNTNIGTTHTSIEQKINTEKSISDSETVFLKTKLQEIIEEARDIVITDNGSQIEIKTKSIDSLKSVFQSIDKLIFEYKSNSLYLSQESTQRLIKYYQSEASHNPSLNTNNQSSSTGKDMVDGIITQSVAQTQSTSGISSGGSSNNSVTTTHSERKTNEEFLYRGNDIVKLWEQYLKKLDSNIKFYLRDEYGGIVNSIFNGLAQNNEIAIVIRSNENPYINKKGQTITLCGEVNYTGAESIKTQVIEESSSLSSSPNSSINVEIQKTISEALEQIRFYNNNPAYHTKITDHILIFPYHAGPLHWNLGYIELNFDPANTTLLEAIISIYEPFGGQASGYKDLITSINLLADFNTVKIKPKISDESPHIKQQYDSSSCGAITAENGKEFLKCHSHTDTKNLLQVSYPAGATELRGRHIQEINDEAFFIAQRDNIAYEVTGDQPIANKSRVMESLESIILKSENDGIQEVIRQIRDTLDDTTRRTSLDIFKQFLIGLDLLNYSRSLYISNTILKSNGNFKEGAIDLIKELKISHSVGAGSKLLFNHPQINQKAIETYEIKEKSTDTELDRITQGIKSLEVSISKTSSMVTKDIGVQDKTEALDYTQKDSRLTFQEIRLNAIYNEEQILKIWDNYINKLQLKYFFGTSEQVRSIFNINDSMAIINGAGILVYEDGKLFINSNLNSVSICGSVDYILSFAKMHGYNSITHNIENAFEQISVWNTFNLQNLISSHIVIFPYHITLGHWRLGALELNFDKTGILIKAEVNIYNPLLNYSNQQMVDPVKKDIQDSINKIFKTNLELVISEIDTHQQQDSNSCGVISAENGKDIIDGKQARIHKTYPPDASDLRFQHVSEVEDTKFHQIQLIPVKWEIPTLISPNVISEIQSLCRQELLQGNRFIMKVDLARLENVSDGKKKAELFHKILEKNKHIFEEIVIRELKYQFYYDDSSSEDEESSRVDSYNYYQIKDNSSDTHRNLTERLVQSNLDVPSQLDIKLSFITHEIGIRLLKSTEVTEKYFPLKRNYLGNNIVPEKTNLKSFIQEVLLSNIQKIGINSDAAKESITKAVEDLMKNPRKILKSMSLEDTCTPFSYSRYFELPTTEIAITAETVLLELCAIHADFSKEDKTITRKEKNKSSYKANHYNEVYNYQPKNRVQELLKQKILNLETKITVREFIKSILTNSDAIQEIQCAMDPAYLKFDLEVQHNICEKLKTFNQQYHTKRTALPKFWAHELNDGWETPTDLLAVGRLMTTSLKRAYKNAQEHTSILLSNEVTFTRKISLSEIDVVEIQKLYKNTGARSDKVTIETQGKSASYYEIALTMENLKLKLNIEDSDIARWIRDTLHGQAKGDYDIFDEGNWYVCTEDQSEKKDIAEFISTVTYLLFQTEVFRNPSSLIIHQMMLDLIIDEKLTFMAVFTNGAVSGGYMPMSQKKIDKPEMGVVDVSRLINAFYKTSMKYSYDKAKAEPIKTQETSDYFKSFIFKEVFIIKNWLLHKHGIAIGDKVSFADYLVKLCASCNEWWGINIEGRNFLIDKILTAYDLDEIEGIECLSVDELIKLETIADNNREAFLDLLREEINASEILELENKRMLEDIASDGISLALKASTDEELVTLRDIIDLYNKDKTLFWCLVKDPDHLIGKHGFQEAKERIEKISQRNQNYRNDSDYEAGNTDPDYDSYDEAGYSSPGYHYHSDDSQNACDCSGKSEDYD